MKDYDKEKYVYSSCEITFDEKGSWSFNDDFARNATTYGIDNSSSSLNDILKNVFLILGEWDTFGINRSLGAPEKKLIFQ